MNKDLFLILLLFFSVQRLFICMHRDQVSFEVSQVRDNVRSLKKLA